MTRSEKFISWDTVQKVMGEQGEVAQERMKGTAGQQPNAIPQQVSEKPLSTGILSAEQIIQGIPLRKRTKANTDNDPPSASRIAKPRSEKA